MDLEFVKLLSPALKPEREVEINICIFILLLQFPSGASPAQGWPLFVPGGFAGGIAHHLLMQDFKPSPELLASVGLS